MRLNLYRRGVGRIVFGVVALAAGYAVWSGGLLEYASPERVRATVASAGAAGPLIFIAMLVPLNLIFLAGPPIWLSATLWPAPLAILYSALGAVLASFGAYAMARYFGREWARAKIPQNLRRFEERLERRPIRIVATMRVMFWLNPGIDLLIAVSRVRARDYLIATVLALVPFTALRVLIGQKGIEAALNAAPWFWPTVIAVVIAVAGLRWYQVRSRRDAIEAAAEWISEPLGILENGEDGIDPLPRPARVLTIGGIANGGDKVSTEVVKHR